VLNPTQQEQVADTLEDDAQLMSNTQLEQLLAGEPQDVQNEIIDINTTARHRALQIALVIPLLAALLGFANAFRMVRLPDPKPSGAEVMDFG
jgi:hypothetical protein